jgi:hypothetical protein
MQEAANSTLIRERRAVAIRRDGDDFKMLHCSRAKQKLSGLSPDYTPLHESAELIANRSYFLRTN